MEKSRQKSFCHVDVIFFVVARSEDEVNGNGTLTTDSYVVKVQQFDIKSKATSGR